MPRAIPPPLSLALTYLRTARGWTQQDLAEAAGLISQTICDFEKGTRRKVTRETLEDLVAKMGYAPEDVTLALLFLGGLSPAVAKQRLSPVEPSPTEVRRARRIAARVGLTEASSLYAQLLELARARRVEQARLLAARQWEALRRCAPARRRALVERSPELQHWALAERLCAESVRLAADRADLALELASLALRVAELAPGDDGWRSVLQGYCRAFVANAQRVASNLPAAAASFATAWRLWQAGEAEGRALLGEWRLLDLEASLRRGQRQFAAALDLLERALAAAPAAARGRILLNKEFTLEQAGELEAALATLQEAAPLVEAAGDPDLQWSLFMNRVVMLTHLGRFAQAEGHLPELHAAALARGKRLDLTRVVWLSGRVAAGQGRREPARGALEQARREFAECGNAYDTALVSLELAILALEEGRAAEVGALAEEMVAIFSAQRVQREALAAVNLFRRAARAHTATVELARQLLDYLERAQSEPLLPFEEQA